MVKLSLKIISVAVIFLLIGYSLGYIYGFTSGVKWAVKVGLKFTTIKIDAKALANALIQYRDNINYNFNIS